MDPQTKISKSMSYLLRHGAKNEGVHMTDDGYVNVKEVVQFLRKNKMFELKKCINEHFTNDDVTRLIQHIVDTNEKNRFGLDERGHELYIRSRQGHTLREVKDKDLLQRITTPTIAVHGTYKKNLLLILEQGLKTIGRNHIHFASRTKDVVSGMRKNCEIAIYIDMAKAMADGIEFWRSDNGVILTSGKDGVLDKKYFEKIIDLVTDSVIYGSDGAGSA